MHLCCLSQLATCPWPTPSSPQDSRNRLNQTPATQCAEVTDNGRQMDVWEGAEGLGKTGTLDSLVTVMRAEQSSQGAWSVGGIVPELSTVASLPLFSKTKR